MSRTDAYAYGSGAVLQGSQGAAASSSLTAAGARPVAGGYDTSHCASTKSDGSMCQAAPAKGTELCVGHLRQQGRL